MTFKFGETLNELKNKFQTKQNKQNWICYNRKGSIQWNLIQAIGGYFIISFFIFVILYLELQFGSFISMKGGSKIDGSHLEPIADRDYMARGNKFK